MSLIVANGARARPTMRDLTAPRRPSRIAWGVAAAVALGLHLGVGALVYARYRAVDSEPELGAQAVEIGVEIAAPRADPSDLPPGPQADEAAAATAQPEQQVKTKDAALPKDIPDESPDAERTVTPVTSPKPKEESKALAAPSKASTPSLASEAAAPPPSKVATPTLRSTAPALGTGDSAQRVRATWQRELVAHLNRHKRYPAGAGARSAEIVVSFTLDRTGHVLDERVVKGSGAAVFDQAALEMIRRANPVPAPPPLVADEGLSFTVPVVFQPRGRR